MTNTKLVLLHSEQRNATLLHRFSTPNPTSVPKPSTPCKMDDLLKKQFVNRQLPTLEGEIAKQS